MGRTGYPRSSIWAPIITLLAILALMALIVIPRIIVTPINGQRESRLRSNLQRLRSAISQFQEDTGVWPARLEDLVAPYTQPPKGIKHGKYKGPYLTPCGGLRNTGLPTNPFAQDANHNYFQDTAAHWTYNPKDGSVISAVNGVTPDGVPYSAL